MVIYYCITILANIAAIPIFYEYINISALSIVPLFLIALMIFQALLFKNEKVENGFRTAYGSTATRVRVPFSCISESITVLSADKGFCEIRFRL